MIWCCVQQLVTNGKIPLMRTEIMERLAGHMESLVQTINEPLRLTIKTTGDSVERQYNLHTRIVRILLVTLIFGSSCLPLPNF